MKVEELAQRKIKISIALLFSLMLWLPSVWAFPGPQQEQPASAQSTAGQPRESAASTRQLSFEERADIFMARKSYEDAVDYYYRALKQVNFSNAIVWNKLGIAYQQLQNYSASRKAYNQAVRRQRNYAEPLNNIGTTYFMERKYGKSVKYYLRALKLSPDSASYHLNLGTSYMHMKKFKESVDEYRTALTLDPNIFTQRSAFGTTIEARGADPENTPSLRLRGFLLRSSGSCR
jgi:tetratricopeptide (TPR) repeat protein